jgi:hypothetical protein
MFAKDPFDIRRRQPLQNIPDGGMRGRPFPTDLEGLVELSPMSLRMGNSLAMILSGAFLRGAMTPLVARPCRPERPAVTVAIRGEAADISSL